MEKLTNYLKSNNAKRLYWSFTNLIVLLIAGAVTSTGFYPIILLPLLNEVTKYININYLS